MAFPDRDSIISKVRRIARKPSTNEVTDVAIIEYINTFVLYDFPELLRLFTYRKTFSFYTTPNVDTYYTNPDATAVNDPMYDFKNVIITSHDPVYIAGFKVSLSQRRQDFWNTWNYVQSKKSIGTGDGITTNFTGTLGSIPVTPRRVLFSSIDTNNVGQSLIDRPLVSAIAGQLGTEFTYGNTYDPRGVVPDAPTATIATNTINYVTGVYDITFTVAPASGVAIYSQTVPYKASRPTSLLFFDNTFTVRPIPDDTYEVKIEAFVRPTELTSASQNPDLEQFWQLIAYGAAIKLLQDLTDFDTVEQLMPEFDRQKIFVNRRTLEQMEDQRAPTIYGGNESGEFSNSQYWWNR